MFRWIKGQIIDKSSNDIIISSHGVGYRIFCVAATLTKNEIGKDTILWLYTAVRENAIDIYGFLNKKELEFFELLLTISGIGPKSALAIMGTAHLDTIQEGLVSGDAAYLAKITGLGKKTAEKIMLGLKDKVGNLENSQSQNAGSFAIDALTTLGYSEKDARQAVQKIKNKENTGDIVKEALKNLSGKK